MQAGLSIDRSSLLQMFSSVNAHPNAPITDSVDLTRLGLPVNDTNLQQLSDYKNLSYELGSGMQGVADSVRQTLMDLISNGDVSRAGALMEGLTQMALGGEIPEELALLRPEQLSDQQMTGEKLPDGFADGALSAQVSQAEGQSATVDAAGRMVSQPSADPNVSGVGPLSASDLPVSSDPNGSAAAGSAAAPDALNAQAPGSAAERALLLLRGLQAQEASEETPNASAQDLSAKGKEGSSIVPDPALPGNGAPDGIQANPGASASPLSQAGLPEQLPAEMRQVADLLTSLGAETNLKNASPAQLLQTLSGAIHTLLAKGDNANLHKLLQSPDVRDLTLNLLKAQWTITPSEVSDKEKVQNLYHRLNTQLEQLTQTLEKQDLTNTSAFQNSSNMHQNLDFLQQINQMYAYVQLPIRLSQGDTAHGDLYVYTNGKKLTGNESTVSALLHLDMEHLGPLDVYVALDRSGIEQKVSTQFYVQDDEILDFLDAHMDELVKHLQSRGYPCSCKMHIRGEQEAEGNAETLPDQSGVNFLLVSQAHIRGGDISFDVRT
ncbi:MAG: flagellar hook-length control protein FliK, partial [Lachnospiraceae bacterium]|nr:flagellar hook-length control protein FliK [Lachnospiraceae bacterium]